MKSIKIKNKKSVNISANEKRKKYRHIHNMHTVMMEKENRQRRAKVIFLKILLR